jgi:hypothetical protein
MPVQTVRVVYINNEANGFADNVEVAAGTTISEFFASKMPSRSPSDYLILVNRDHVRRDQVLVEGDHVTVAPKKVQGA